MIRTNDSEIRERLSPEAKKQIQSMSGARPVRFLIECLVAWAVIVGAILVATIAHNVLVSILCIFIVATRQNVLGLLIHEQTHYCGFRGRYGDLIANALAGYPLIVLSVENYAKVHLAHHQKFFTTEDPDFLRKNGKDWILPHKSAALLGLFLKDLVGLTLIRNIKSKNVTVPDEQFRRRNPTPAWFKIGYFCIAAAILTVTHGWWVFLIYWVIPLVTVLQVLVRWGALCEHIYGVEDGLVEDTSPTIILSRLDYLLIPNLNFTLHPYHHYYPAVSFANLPKVHAIFDKEGLIREDLVFNGYFAYLKFLFRGSRINVERTARA